MAGNLVVPADGYEVTGNKATNVGNYTATITGKGNFKGEVTAQYGIVPDAEAVFALTLNPTEFVYDGTEKKPAVTVKDGETVLVEGTDYTLAYANNVNAGTATVTDGKTIADILAVADSNPNIFAEFSLGLNNKARLMLVNWDSTAGDTNVYFAGVTAGANGVGINGTNDGTGDIFTIVPET